MSKIKNAQLEEQALEVATFALDHIDAELRKDDPDIEKLAKLTKVYSDLKPYF